MMTVADDLVIANNLKQISLTLARKIRLSTHIEFRRHVEQVMKTNPVDWQEIIFDKAISLFQGEHGEVGRQFETLFCDAINQACGTQVVVQRWRMPGAYQSAIGCHGKIARHGYLLFDRQQHSGAQIQHLEQGIPWS